MAENKALTYMSYLKVEDLLALQEPRSAPPEHDEMLFIVIHQVYELWFKQVLHELGALERAFERDDSPAILHTLKRVLTILKTMVGQIDILETMTPVQFSSFRDRLESASGFQSRQFRMFEARLGKRDPRTLVHHQSDAKSHAILREIYDSPSIYDGFLRWLHKRGLKVPEELLSRDVSGPVPESETVRATLIDIYRKNAPETAVAEHLIDLDEGIQEWRYRHVKMVERVIGIKMGSGGSSGAEYLRSTLFKPLFPDLWAIRVDL